MADSANLKIKRAANHIADLNDVLRERRPFSYILETNAKTGERATFAKRNEPVIYDAALICGDVIHNLRSALDHAYWEIVSPFTKTDRERTRTQFPFSEAETGLGEAVKLRFADRVGDKFFAAMLGLKPYGAPGGNEALHLIHQLNIVDKHRLLIPTGDYKKLSSDILRLQIPDMPANVTSSSFGNNRRDLSWQTNKLPSDIGVLRPPSMHIFEKELDVPVDIVFVNSDPKNPRPVIQTLNLMVDATHEAIKIIREAAPAR